jgi:hypothetical protein
MADDARLDTSAAQSLMAMSAALARGAPAEGILFHIAREVQRMSGVDTVAIDQLDTDTSALSPVAGYPERTPAVAVAGQRETPSLDRLVFHPLRGPAAHEMR